MNIKLIQNIDCDYSNYNVECTDFIKHMQENKFIKAVKGSLTIYINVDYIMSVEI